MGASLGGSIHSGIGRFFPLGGLPPGLRAGGGPVEHTCSCVRCSYRLSTRRIVGNTLELWAARVEKGASPGPWDLSRTAAFIPFGLVALIANALAIASYIASR